MGFLKRFFRNVFRDGATPTSASSFDQLSEADLEAHLGVARYGSFTLTDAIRPSYDLQVVPRQGYRHGTRERTLTTSLGPTTFAMPRARVRTAAGATAEIKVDQAGYPAGAPINWNVPPGFRPAGVGAR